ncbi:hypothetical protein M406DRAFT_284353 [Cryphonectria parasitica EP155]|uniref:E3 ubiquitin protein ligase n=1 Tax=Cryphonectria parasitica (strain ATCC 38755 / EP155) TaxID=660469 RepID=A0A9P5CTP0_CRYP1|nr:uncharacterized protein M406DRAFT_284353 [Cryphonectria parasitica EP155]KAF3769877.1 hypothetical protein M406DRAFT_284353 [Cryphonectria parasitica EP155]
MEDRKRPISSAEDLAPPSKRQQVNGSSKSRDDAGDEAWIESYQKDAIYRQMLEYKREKTRLESRLEDLSKQYEYYDDHLRIIDAWWLQLLQEVQLSAEGIITDDNGDVKPSTGLGFQDSPSFKSHLSGKASSIKTALDSLFRRLAANKGDVKPDIADLESKVKTLLAKQKEDKVQLEGLIQKKDELSASLDAAMLRAVKAEKKLDRAKSAQVQKMEQQAIGQALSRPSPAAEEKNGTGPSPTTGNDEALQLKYEEATAGETKLKAQLDAAMSEIKTLKEENSTLQMRKEGTTDEDFVRTDVFKAFKGQNEDLIRRVNDLEVINKQLRHEAEKLQAERSSFRTQLEREAQAVTADLEDQILSRDQDLTRIRSARDELLAELGVRKNAQDQERTSIENMKELVGAKEDRISALEMELERLRPDANAMLSENDPDLEALGPEELRQQYTKLKRELEALAQELPAIEKAYKRSMTLSQKKVMDQVAAEERMSILIQEKSKADQKYFAARKDADIRNNEIKTLRQQNGKSSEIIAALKDHDSQARTLNSNLEKQLTDLKQSNLAILEENRTLKSSTADAVRRADQVKTQISELQNLVKSKDAIAISVKEQANIYQVEVEKLKKRVDSAHKERDTWKKKSLSNISPGEELLNNILWCNVCRKDRNDRVITTCGHILCKNCAEDRIINRMRGCPICTTRYDKNNIVPIYLTSADEET